jgi:hypothetical protein
MGKADAIDGVPMRSTRRQRQRPPRTSAYEALLGIQLVEEWEQIVLVCSAPMEQNEPASRLVHRSLSVVKVLGCHLFSLVWSG